MGLQLQQSVVPLIDSHAPPNPLDVVAKKLGIQGQQQDLAINQQKLNAATLSAQQQAQIQQVLKDPTSWDPQSGLPTSDAIQKVGQIHAPTGTALNAAVAAHADTMSQVAQRQGIAANDQAEALARPVVAKGAADKAAADLLDAQTKAAKIDPLSPAGIEAQAQVASAKSRKDFEDYYKDYVAAGNPDNGASRLQARQQFSMLGKEPPKQTDSERYAQLAVKISNGTATKDEQTEMRALKERATLASTNTFNLNQGEASQDPIYGKVDPKERDKVKESVDKINQAYTQAQRANADLASTVDAATSGNRVAAKYAPVEGVLQLNVGAGVKRVNRQEIDQYAGAGSVFDRIKGWFDGATVGQPVPPNILADMKSLQALVTQNAKIKHDQDIRDIDTNHGSNAASKFVKPDAAPAQSDFIKPGGALEGLLKGKK